MGSLQLVRARSVSVKFLPEELSRGPRLTCVTSRRPMPSLEGTCSLWTRKPPSPASGQGQGLRDDNSQAGHSERINIPWVLTLRDLHGTCRREESHCSRHHLGSRQSPRWDPRPGAFHSLLPFVFQRDLDTFAQRNASPHPTDVGRKNNYFAHHCEQRAERKRKMRRRYTVPPLWR